MILQDIWLAIGYDPLAGCCGLVGGRWPSPVLFYYFSFYIYGIGLNSSLFMVHGRNTIFLVTFFGGESCVCITICTLTLGHDLEKGEDGKCRDKVLGQ